MIAKRKMFIEPMLLQNADKPFDSDQHYFELKSNGVRVMLERQNGKNKLFNRNGTEITERIPELENIELDDCYLDGELVCYCDGKENFEAATSRVSLIQENKIIQGSKQFPLTYIVFDILRHKNNNLMKEPLSYRKKILSETLLIDQKAIKKSFFIESEGKMLFEQIKTLGLEGIVAKSKDSTYIPAHRSLNWLKMINWQFSHYYITGYKKQGMGLLISELRNGDFVNVGLVEFGMNTGQKTAFFSITKHIKTGEDKNYIYVEPFVRCVIKSRGQLSNGELIEPIFHDFIV